MATQPEARRLLTAGQLPDGALGGWHPQVGRAGIEHDLEGLPRSSELDGSVVLGLEVGKRKL